MFRLICATLAVVSLSQDADAIIYVSPNGDNSQGTSWATAFTSVAMGVSGAQATDGVLWIAAGTYPVSASISIPSNITIYGGFPATGNPGFDQRDTDANPTTLDGQFMSHIFNCSGATGVTIDGVQFTRADSDIGAGGAVRVVSGSDVTINDCRFFNNTASQYGGGVYVEGGNADISNCIFTDNFANEAGAVMLFQGTATITDSLFDGNDGAQGGAILVYVEPVTINRCVFTNNTGDRGAAVAIREGTGCRITNSLFEGNVSTDQGGAVNLESQLDIEIVNCTFVANDAASRGGGVFFGASNGFLANCIFDGNTSQAIYENDATSDPMVVNSLFFANPDGVYFDEGMTVYNDAAALDAGVTDAADNIDGDPRFVNAGSGDYHILASSPARDAGTSTSAPLDDIDGDLRDLLVDIGFDEFIASAGRKTGCFIATAAYGTPLAHELDTLRDARDVHLLTNAIGASFADAYYRVSPAIAQRIADQLVLRTVVRVLLVPVIALAEHPWIAVLFLSALLITGATRRVRCWAIGRR